MSTELFEVIVIKLDGTQARTQLSLTQIREIVDSGGQVFQRHYTVTFTNPDGSTFVGSTLMLKSTAEIQGIAFKLGAPFEDRPFILHDLITPPPPPPLPTPTPSPTEEAPTTQEPTQPSTQEPSFVELISISPGVFQILSDRVVGEAIYIAAPGFTDTKARAIMTVSTVNGINLAFKEVTLNFTETERDERIFFNESVFGETQVRVELFVWEFTDPVILGSKKSFTVGKLEPTVQPPFLPTPGIQAPGVAGTAFGVAAVGLIGLGVLGSLMGKKKK